MQSRNVLFQIVESSSFSFALVQSPSHWMTGWAKYNMETQWYCYMRRSSLRRNQFHINTSKCRCTENLYTFIKWRHGNCATVKCSFNHIYFCMTYHSIRWPVDCGGNTSSCFRTFWIGNVSGKLLPVRALQFVSLFSWVYWIQRESYTIPRSQLSHRFSWRVRKADTLFHCTPLYGTCRITDQYTMPDANIC
jgi:hypothetical protein